MNEEDMWDDLNFKGGHNSGRGCEICDADVAKRRIDNLYVCKKCNEQYPIGE